LKLTKYFHKLLIRNFLFFSHAGVNEQGRGLLYKNVLDCFVKTLRVEGFWALYKGFSANYMRIAPHTMLNLVIWEQLKKWKDLYYENVAYFE
jgi:solute carrier family 25, member 34/35